MVFRSQELITDHYQKAHQVSFYDADKDVDTTHPDDTDLNMANPASIEDLGMNGKAGVSMVESVAMDNLHSVDKVIGEAGLSVSMVNGDICASEQCAEEDSGGTSEHPGVFDHNGLQEAQGSLHVSGAGESPNEGGVTIKVLSPNDAASAGISLSDPDDSLMDRLHTNGILSIVNGNRSVSETLSPTDVHVPEQKPRVSERVAMSETESRPDFNFILQTEMVKGSTFTYGKTWFKCLHCAFKTSTKMMIAKHMQEDHVNLIDPHQGLELKDITGNDKRKIMKMSTYESIFGRESRFRRCTKKGKRPEKQDVPGVYTCSTCGKVFTRTRYLRKHHETHKTEKKYLCDECGKSFKSRTYLQVHRRIHKEKLFRCNQCDFKSKINAAIHAHRQVHSQGSVLCDICGYAYTDKSTLNKHKRVHDLNRPYKCNFPGCTWRFKTEVMCKAHIRAHTTEGKFKCSFCGYLFRHKHHLQRHETSMHGVKHTKTRTNHMAGRKKDMDDDDDEQDMNLVINAVEDALPLPEETQHLVVATDNQGTPIAFEGTDLSALNVAYQTLFQSQDGNNARTLVMSQPETQVIFKPAY